MPRWYIAEAIHENQWRRRKETKKRTPTPNHPPPWHSPTRFPTTSLSLSSHTPSSTSCRRRLCLLPATTRPRPSPSWNCSASTTTTLRCSIVSPRLRRRGGAPKCRTPPRCWTLPRRPSCRRFRRLRMRPLPPQPPPRSRVVKVGLNTRKVKQRRKKKKEKVVMEAEMTRIKTRLRNSKYWVRKMTSVRLNSDFFNII